MSISSSGACAQDLVDVWVYGRRSILVLSGADQSACARPARETVGSFAEQLHKSPEALLEQLRAAGVHKSSVDCTLSEVDKQQLLAHLRRLHGTPAGGRKKITLVRRGGAATTRCRVDQDAAKECNRAANGQTGRVNKVILVGNLGRSQPTDHIERLLIEAYWSMHWRAPVWHEAETMKSYSARLAAIRKAVDAGDRDAVVLAIRQCFDGVNSRLLQVLEAVVLELVAGRFNSVSTASVLIAWESLAARLTLSKVKTKCLRAGNTEAALAAWRLRRNKRFFPASVATIALN